jgi:hypothetical protein
MASWLEIVWPIPDLIRESQVGNAIRAGDCQSVFCSCGHRPALTTNHLSRGRFGGQMDITESELTGTPDVFTSLVAGRRVRRISVGGLP